MTGTDTSAATVVRDGETLRFGGALLRESIAALWRQLQNGSAGVRVLDLSAVQRIDSAGLALVSLLAARGEGIELHGIAEGGPAGFAELREAYRLGHGLAFVRD